MKFVAAETGVGVGDEEVWTVAGEEERLDNDEGDSVEFCWAVPFAGEAVPLLKEGIEENDI